ncbi:MAG: DUF6932 family protein [Solirubrobacteraceae bacterium]
MIHEFDEAGNPPAGIHHTAWHELATRYGTTAHRRQLLDGLRRALESLRAAGCRRVYINGSFVTAKDQPGDFDVCWEASNVDPALLDLTLLDFSDRRRPQNAKFGDELFPAEVPPTRPAPGSSTTSSRTRPRAHAKASVALDLKDLP